MFSWKTYVPFAPEQDMEVVAQRWPFKIRGSAKCAEISDDRVRIGIQIPETSILGRRIPDTAVDIFCVHRGRIDRNYAQIALNDEIIEDANVLIQDYPSVGRVRIDPSIDGRGGADIAFSLRRRGSEVEITDISGFPDLDGVSIRIGA